jgi:hypothetical protein
LQAAAVQLERLALHLRRRSPLEAIDLGCAMARTWWKPLLAAWLPLYLVATLLVHFVFSGSYVVAIFVLWWLKPLFDRAALDVLSRAVFGESPRVFDVWRSVLRSPGIVASLTFYRFDLARSFNLPIWHLERLRGGVATRRARALHGRSRRHAVWATIVFLHFELVITLSIWAGMDLLNPSQLDGEFGLTSLFQPDKAQWQQWLDAAVYALTVSVLEPVYVAAGFALYLNRRTQLEAWDVELALRRFATRARPRLAAAAVTLLLTIVIVPGGSQTVHAAQITRSSPAETIADILKTPEFEQYKEVKRFEYTGRGASSEPSVPGAERERSQSSPTYFAEVLRALMWIAAVVLVLYAARVIWRHLGKWLPKVRTRREQPPALFGLDIAPESLPADIAAAALAALDAGRTREALSLLYRGALSVLVDSGTLKVADGDTEGDCVRRVAAHGDSGKAGFFAELVNAWQSTAYAGRLPEAERLRALCGDWRAHFSDPRPA